MNQCNQEICFEKKAYETIYDYFTNATIQRYISNDFAILYPSHRKTFQSKGAFLTVLRPSHFVMKIFISGKTVFLLEQGQMHFSDL